MIDTFGGFSDRDLYPLDLAIELVSTRTVVRRNRRPTVQAHIAAIIGRENHRHRYCDFSFPDLLAVGVQSYRAALGQAAASVSKLHAHLVLARGQPTRGLGVEELHAAQVVAIFELASLCVQAPSA